MIRGGSTSRQSLRGRQPSHSSILRTKWPWVRQRSVRCFYHLETPFQSISPLRRPRLLLTPENLSWSSPPPSPVSTFATTAGEDASALSNWKQTTKRLLDYPSTWTPEIHIEAQAAIDWWTQQSSAEGVDQCISILDRWIQETQELEDPLYQVLRSWNRCWIPHGTSLFPVRMLFIIDDFFRRGLQISSPERMLEIYSLVLEASTHKPLDAADGVLDPWFSESILDRMVEVCHRQTRNERDMDVTPHMWSLLRQAFVSVVDAWVRAASAADHAEALLARMYRLATNHSSCLRPDRETCNAVLRAWVANADTNPIRAAQRAHAILKKMQQEGDAMEPDAHSYSAVIECWIRCNETDRAATVLEELERRYRTATDNTSLRPSSRVYDVVIQAIARQSPDRADTLLHRALALAESTGDANLRLNIAPYGAVLNAWARTSERGAAHRAQALLKTMLQSDYTPNPNASHLNSVLRCWSKSKESGREKRAEDLLHQMVALYRAGNESAKPDAVSFNIVIHIWATAGNSVQSLSVLECMQTLAKETGDPTLRPDTISFNTVLKALAKSSMGTASKRAKKAEALLRKMDALGYDSVKPDALSFATVLQCWIKSIKHGSAERAEAILSEMEERYRTGDVSFLPNAMQYGAVIKSWVNSNSPGAASRAESILKRATTLADSTQYSKLVLDGKTYKSVLQALTRERNAGQRASVILKRMIQEGALTAPDTADYLAVMKCWARSSEKLAAERAEAVLNEMINVHGTGQDTVKPDVFCYTTVISAWARNDASDSGTRALRVLKRMLSAAESSGDIWLRPTLLTFNLVLRALERDGDAEAAEEAEAMLSTMQLWDVQPDTATYNAIMSVWVKSGRKDAASKALSLLDRLTTQSESINDSACQPDNLTFKLVLKALALSHEEGMDMLAEDVLSRSKQFGVQPDSIMFNSVVRVWVKSGQEGWPEKAELLLKRMETLAKSIGVRPDVRSFSMLIDGLAKSGEDGAAEKAEAILERMFDLCKAGEESVKPDAIAYCSVIEAWCRTGLPDGPERGEKLLRDMWVRWRAGDKRFRPTAVPYNTIIAGWAKSGDSSAVSHAEALVNEMLTLGQSDHKDVMPNETTFQCLLLAVQNSNLPDKPDRVKIILSTMQHHGIGLSEAASNLVDLLAAEGSTETVLPDTSRFNDDSI